MENNDRNALIEWQICNRLKNGRKMDEILREEISKQFGITEREVQRLFNKIELEMPVSQMYLDWLTTM